MRARRIVLASRPTGLPRTENFRLEEISVANPEEGQVRLRVLYASADPYMRMKMNDAPSYTPAYEIGELITGRTVCEVEESRDPRFAEGDLVAAVLGWQSRAVLDGDLLTLIDSPVADASAYLGVLGMPGFTAYAGLARLGRPVAGETLVVAAALGPVGATVAQIATLRGLSVVAIAGGPHKTAILREEFGIATALDHRAPDFAERLAAATPDGIDVYFENVGGAVAAAVYPRLNLYARVPLCGMVADYNHDGEFPGPDRLPGFYRDVLVKSLDIRGFIATEFVEEMFGQFQVDMSTWVRDGRVQHREHVIDGLENAPAALLAILAGDNIGKAVIRIG